MMLLLLAAIGSAPAQTTTQSREAHPLPAQLPMSPSASEAVRRFEDAIATEQAAFRALPATGAIGPNLTIRIALEQAMRRVIDPAVAPLSGSDRSAASAAIWQRIGAIDAANTAYVKAVLPADGWFRSRRDGADVAHNAWLIVQHSPDQAFQRLIALRMRPMVASGDARGADYALLYDRTEMAAGRPQLYGSQMTCIGGRWQAAQTLDPAKLDDRRAVMGLPPMAEYMKNFEASC
jgi:hypothetical protein